MSGEPDLVSLLYCADWTRLSLTAEVSVTGTATGIEPVRRRAATAGVGRRAVRPSHRRGRGSGRRGRAGPPGGRGAAAGAAVRAAAGAVVRAAAGAVVLAAAGAGA